MLGAGGLWHPTPTVLTSSLKVGLHQHVQETAGPKDPKAASPLVQPAPESSLPAPAFAPQGPRV